MNLGENKYRVLTFIFCVIAIEAIMFSIGNYKLSEQVRLEEDRIAVVNEKINELPILAKSVSIYNISQSKKIYGKNDTVVMPIASLAKIMTVAVGLSDYQKGGIVSLTPEAIQQAGDFGLFAHEKWKVEDLAKITLISSANDGAYMFGLGEQFLEEVNRKVKRLGAADTTFLNVTGLDIEGDDPGVPARAGVFSTAEDVNTMAIYLRIAYPEIADATVMPEITIISQSGFEHNFKNTNIILEKIPNLLFSKTGFTDIAGGSLVVIFKDKIGDEIAVTLLSSTFEGRFTDMESIIRVLYNQNVLK